MESERVGGWKGVRSPWAEGLLEWACPGKEVGRVKAGVGAVELGAGASERWCRS